MTHMKTISTSLAVLAVVILFTLPFPSNALSQGASADRSQAAPKNLNRQRNAYRTVDTRCHTYGGYGWGPYWGPCPFRGAVHAAQPGPPVFGPFLPFGPFW